MKLMASHSKRDIIAILGALSIFLSLIEHIIPKPVPFIKLGIANIPILVSLILLKPKDIILLILLKSLGSTILSGTIFSWLTIYSLLGSLFSGLSMIIIKSLFKTKVSMIGVSVLGAFINNLIQLTIALLVLGKGVIYLGVPILIVGLISGIFTGLFSNKFINESKWIRSIILKI